MSFARASIVLALLGFACVNLGCGGEVEEHSLDISFQRHALECEVQGIQAILEATGVNGVCPLTVNADRSVTGVCVGVPAGAIRDFRLVYFTVVNLNGSGVDVQLATAVARLDLRQETRRTVRLEFAGPPSPSFSTDFDDDGDGRDNIHEICAGTNPVVRD